MQRIAVELVEPTQDPPAESGDPVPS
jgi:hypothetical protein